MINPILKLKLNNNIKLSAKEILKYIDVENVDITSKVKVLKKLMQLKKKQR